MSLKEGDCFLSSTKAISANYDLISTTFHGNFDRKKQKRNCTSKFLLTLDNYVLI